MDTNSELPFAFVSKQRLVQILSYENCGSFTGALSKNS